jgi:hypothetical protein
MKVDRIRKRIGSSLAVTGALLLGLVGVSGAVSIKASLTPTPMAPNATGRGQLSLKRSKGKFEVRARRLAPNSTFDLMIGGVKVGTFATNAAGSGKAKFRTKPHRGEGLLGFDPRGHEIVVREDDGDDDLVGEMPDDGDSASGACCIQAHDGETECEDLSADECTHEGGSPSGADSCLPNPCETTPPPHEIVCCIAESAHGGFVDEDPEVECEEVHTSTECATKGGTVVEAASCEANPCKPTPPSGHVACCVPDEDETECEELTPESCQAHHGTPTDATSCDAHPCGGGDGHEGGDGSGHD